MLKLYNSFFPLPNFIMPFCALERISFSCPASAHLSKLTCPRRVELSWIWSVWAKFFSGVPKNRVFVVVAALTALFLVALWWRGLQCNPRTYRPRFDWNVLPTLDRHLRFPDGQNHPKHTDTTKEIHLRSVFHLISIPKLDRRFLLSFPFFSAFQKSINNNSKSRTQFERMNTGLIFWNNGPFFPMQRINWPKIWCTCEVHPALWKYDYDPIRSRLACCRVQLHSRAKESTGTTECHPELSGFRALVVTDTGQFTSVPVYAGQTQLHPLIFCFIFLVLPSQPSQPFATSHL